VFKIINEHTRQKVESPVAKVLEGGVIVGLANHTILLRKDGKEIPIDDSGAPIRDLNGKATGVVLVFRDITERKKAEQALRESESKANALIRYAPTGIYEMDYRGPRFISVNDAMCQILGYTREELFLIDPSALLDENSRARFADRIRRQLAGEKVEESVEYRVRKKDGSFIDAVLYVSVNLGGAATGRGLVVAYDITERKRAEESLRETQALLRAVMENTSDPVYVKDRQSRILMCNPALEKVAGKPASEIIGKTDSEYYDDPVIGQALSENDLRVMESGLSQAMEETAKTPDGPRIFISSKAPYRNESGDIIGTVGISHDITERKRAEEQIRAQENELRLLMDHVPALISYMSPDFYYRRVNRGYEQWFGLKAQEMEGRHVRDVLGEAAWQAVRSRLERAMAGETVTYEERMPYRVGGPRWIAATLVPERDPAGAVRGLATLVTDITERKRMEEALRKSSDELELRVQERTEQLARSQQRLQQLASQLLLAQEKERKRVAVELHDGLLSELAATKFLLEGKLSFLKKGKLSDLGEFERVGDTLAIAMKEARRIMNNLHPAVLDELGLIAAMNWSCGEYQKSYPHIKVETKIGVSEQDISESTRVVIYRVLQEALNNFAKHGKGNLVELSLSKSDGIFEFMIRDNGQGFDMETAQKGLGLESMRERVELSGGEFQLESGIGQGTTIRAIWNHS
jgi:PAS domain S-box-containing protein